MSTITHGPRSAGWAIDDPVIRLRRSGRRDGFELPPDVDSLLVGSEDVCTLRMQDEVGSVSRQHADLTRDAGIWTIRDRGSKNGLRLDGEPRLSFTLAPGVEIELGKLKLIAESHRLVALQNFLARVIGFGDAYLPALDEALYGVRGAAARRMPLFLCGSGSLVPTVRRIHELALGVERPFLVADGAEIRGAVKSAAGGTLCLEGKVPPADLAFAREFGECALVICAPTAADAAELVEHAQRGVIVEVPSIAQRSDDEREQLLLDYASDAVQVLGVRTNGFREHELLWLRNVTLTSLEDVEVLTLRLVAERVFGQTLAAEKLGITRRALSEYLRRRGIPL